MSEFASLIPMFLAFPGVLSEDTNLDQGLLSTISFVLSVELESMIITSISLEILSKLLNKRDRFFSSFFVGIIILIFGFIFTSL